MEIMNQKTKSSGQPSKLNWEKLNHEWQESGLTQRAFCHEHSLTLSTFVYHRGKLLEKQNTSKSHHFTEVKVKGDASLSSYQNITIHLPNSIRLSIPPNVNETQIKMLLAALGVGTC